SGEHLPTRLAPERSFQGRAEFRRREAATTQLTNPGQRGSVRARGQKDRAVLHEGLAHAALSTADHLEAIDHQIAGGEVLETQTTFALRFVGGRDVRLSPDAQVGKGPSNQFVHAAEPGLPALPRRTRGKSETVGHLVMVDNGTP